MSYVILYDYTISYDIILHSAILHCERDYVYCIVLYCNAMYVLYHIMIYYVVLFYITCFRFLLCYILSLLFANLHPIVCYSIVLHNAT